MEKTKPLTVECTLVGKKQLTDDVIELHYECNPGFAFLPGQFISIIVPGAGPHGRDLRRAYSIASEPEKKIVELCVKVVEGGPGTQFLNRQVIGDKMKGLAPYGDFVYKTKPHKHVIMIATGTGIAPFRSMVYSRAYLDHKPLSTRILFGARDVGDLLYTDELHHAVGKTHYIQALSRPKGEWHGFKGRVTDWLRHCENDIDWNDTEFYLCGNGAMIDEVKQILFSKGVEKPSIHQEIYYKPKADGRADEVPAE